MSMGFSQKIRSVWAADGLRGRWLAPFLEGHIGNTSESLICTTQTERNWLLGRAHRGTAAGSAARCSAFEWPDWSSLPVHLDPNHSLSLSPLPPSFLLSLCVSMCLFRKKTSCLHALSLLTLSLSFFLCLSALINCLFVLILSVCGIVVLICVCSIARTGC